MSEMQANRLRRSLLFVPGDSERKIGKAAQSNADCIILDLEDAVAVAQKETARRVAAEALAGTRFPNERLIRINASDTDFWQADLDAVVSAQPNGIVAPKVETAVSLQQIAHNLAVAEQEHGWPNGSIRLLALVETARGVLNLSQIAEATPRLDALLLGAEDLAADMGAIRTPGGTEMAYARSALVTTAAAYRLQAIDMVFVDFRNLEGLERECVTARQLGFAGKMAIHPGQVEVINRAFSPSPEEIERARQIVATYRAYEADGKGVFEMNGRMVDMPIVRAAQNLLERAKQAGLLNV
ncbi:MAG: CoA ester lyase [Chloroflexi bacterium]|nr:CoA ester lyase [Chloroflexota bacterium]